MGFLLKKLEKAVLKSGVRQVAIAGGVSANSRLREGVERMCARHGWQAFLPKPRFCTDNAAMVGIAGLFKYLHGELADPALPPYAN